MTKEEKKIIKYLHKRYSSNDLISTGFYTYLFVNEEWKPCKYNGKLCREYVSSLGRIYSPISNRLLSIFEGRKGYLKVNVNFINDDSTFDRKDVFVHRAVLCSFVGDPPKKYGKC